MEQIREKYERFKEWQVKPHEVAELTADKHECATCHTEFHGNYCPRCGQKSSVGRYSFKTAFLLFLDVWGLGNRGMFRTIRDLLFRPGYMIRDYLNGMQMAYFPPFKMFFLTIALFVLVDSGFNIRLQNNNEILKEQLDKGINDSLKKHIDEKTDVKSFAETSINDTIHLNGKPIAINKDENSEIININNKEFDLKVKEYINIIIEWFKDHQTTSQLLLIAVLSLPMYRFFRHNKMIPDLRYSEFFVSMVYVTNLMTIVQIIGRFILPGGDSIDFLAYFLSIIALKQLYGYSFKRTLLKVIGAFVVVSSVVIAIIAIIVFLSYLYIEYIL